MKIGIFNGVLVDVDVVGFGIIFGRLFIGWSDVVREEGIEGYR